MCHVWVDTLILVRCYGRDWRGGSRAPGRARPPVGSLVDDAASAMTCLSVVGRRSGGGAGREEGGGGGERGALHDHDPIVIDSRSIVRKFGSIKVRIRIRYTLDSAATAVDQGGGGGWQQWALTSTGDRPGRAKGASL